MPDLIERIADASKHVNPRWTATRQQAVRERVSQALLLRRSFRGSLALALALCVCAGILVGSFFQQQQPSLAGKPTTAAAARVLLRLQDGSSVSGRSEDARVTAVAVSATTATLKLESGSAHFDVTRNEGRQFEVLAGDVRVSVLGTAFSVTLTATAVTVSVDHGRVLVSWPGARRELGAGERLERLSSPARAAQTAGALPAASGSLPVAAGSSIPRAAPPRAAAVSWRSLAQDGDYRAAFARMLQEGKTAVRDEPGDLLFAADVARLSGHPEEAVPRLERVVRGHPSDSRAPLAAFTLGRTLLDQLGRPREAAEVFALARSLSPAGALAQDALAREVESWSRAGETAIARERALTYLERYPGGRREKAVRSQALLP